jgi:hypothetical protein
MSDVMLDLETMGTNPDCVVLTIGAVKFILNPDNNGGKIIEEFYYLINPQSCVDVGMEMSVDTIIWWMKQSDEARAEFQKPTLNIQDVLTWFSDWLSDDPKNIDMWGNGSDFDNVLLANAYRVCGKPLPWRYFNNRCYRTLKNIYPNVDITNVSTGVKHNALDDATFILNETDTGITKLIVTIYTPNNYTLSGGTYDDYIDLELIYSGAIYKDNDDNFIWNPINIIQNLVNTDIILTNYSLFYNTTNFADISEMGKNFIIDFCCPKFP